MRPAGAAVGHIASRTPHLARATMDAELEMLRAVLDASPLKPKQVVVAAKTAGLVWRVEARRVEVRRVTAGQRPPGRPDERQRRARASHRPR